MSQPYTHDLSTTRKLETDRRLAIELRESCLRQVIDLEVSMNVEKRWDLLSPEYLETLGYLATRKYQRALEELQRLVVQRLFELHRMNVSATGECSLALLGFLTMIKILSVPYANAHREGAPEPLQGDQECCENIQCCCCTIGSPSPIDQLGIRVPH